MNTTYFLGAGFSAAFGLPVMRSFFRAIQDSPRISPEDKLFLSDLRREAQAANALLDGDDTNLEHVLSFAVMGVRLSDSEESHSRYDRLRHIVRQVYTDVAVAFRPRTGYAPVGAMFDLSDRYAMANTYSVITTNYDIHAEWAMSHFGLRVAIPGECVSLFADKPSRNERRLYDLTGKIDGRTVQLCKLHGSVNWCGRPDSPNALFVDDGMVNLHSPSDPERDAAFSMPSALRHKDPRPYVPLLVPPTYFKQDIDFRLRHAWIKAGQLLRAADVVVFVGYSFPQSDTDMRYFLATTMTSNINLRRILIVDREAKSIVERLKSFGGMGTRFCRLLHPCEGDWQQALGEALGRRDW